MSALLLTRLGLATLVFTVLAGLLMLARRRLRAWAGAEAVYAIALDLSVDGGPARHIEQPVSGALHLDGLRDAEGRACEAELTARLLPGDLVDVRIPMVCEGQPAGNPRLIARLGEPATIAIGQGERRPDGAAVTSRGFRLTVRVDKL